MHVLLLAGGISNEHDVSVRSGDAIEKALKELGHSVTRSDPSMSGFDLKLLAQNGDVVFLALHGAGGEDGSLQSILEDMHKPFVGSGSHESKLCFDKWEYKQLLQANGLPVSHGKIISLNDTNHALFQSPYVLKPVDGGSSLDTQIVREPNSQTFAASQALLKEYPHMLIEELIEGSEITVGIFDDQALPVIEIVPPSGKEFDYENKYNGATQELCPPESVSVELQHQAQQLALQIHQLTCCRHMSRTDIIIDKANSLHVLETNTIPGLTTQSLLPKMLATAGIPFTTFVERSLELALS